MYSANITILHVVDILNFQRESVVIEAFHEITRGIGDGVRDPGWVIGLDLHLMGELRIDYRRFLEAVFEVVDDIVGVVNHIWDALVFLHLETAAAEFEVIVLFLLDVIEVLVDFHEVEKVELIGGGAVGGRFERKVFPVEMDSIHCLHAHVARVAVGLDAEPDGVKLFMDVRFDGEGEASFLVADAVVAHELRNGEKEFLSKCVRFVAEAADGVGKVFHFFGVFRIRFLAPCRR